MDNIHLSVVAASRNDDHGGKLLYRMQHFVNGFISQCKRHHLKAELILVEWNPPESQLSLIEALQFPDDMGSCRVRVIRVPPEIHQKMNHAEDLPLFQMIAKNVGIRRAEGKYILATNIDILFSDELICFLRDKLEPKVCYRVDRLDVPSELPKTFSMTKLLSFCKENYFRINGRYGTKIKVGNDWEYVGSKISSKSVGTFWVKKFWKIFKKNKFSIEIFRQMKRRIQLRFKFNVHTNACGDFTLLSKDDWQVLHGYPELQGYSWHLDSYLIYQAVLNGIKQKELAPHQSVYHIEHGKGSGFTPEEPEALFKRLDAQKIPYFSYQNLLEKVDEMVRKRKQRKSLVYNDHDWGLADIQLEEVTI